MKNKKLIVIFVIIIVLLICSIGVILIIKNKNNSIEYDEKPIPIEEISNPENYEFKKDKNDKITIFDMEKDDVYAFSFTDKNGVELSFHLDGEKWIYDEDFSINLNNDYMNELLTKICTIQCTAINTNADTSDLNFQEPDLVYSLSDASGNKTKISILTDFADLDIYYYIINDNYEVIYSSDSSLVEISNNTISTMDID